MCLKSGVEERNEATNLFGDTTTSFGGMYLKLCEYFDAWNRDRFSG